MQKSLFTSFIVSLTAILLLGLCSCGKKHPCTGEWRGKTYYGEYLYLTVNKKGTYNLQIFKKEPQTIPNLSMEDHYIYSGKWEKVSDDVIELNYDSFTSLWNGKSEDVNSNGKFYLQSDGAFTQNNMNFANPICKLTKHSD